MKRVFYFVATNLAILLLLGVVLSFFGLGFLGYMAATLVLELVLGFLASLIVMWFSRQREFRADNGGAALAAGRN